MNDQDIKQLTINLEVTNPEQSVFSLKVEDSDFASNQIVLNSLIGTLVKYDISGRIEPYLASEWKVSPDRLRWNFKLREKLFCENGEIIDSHSFRQNLVKQLRLYSKKGSVISFDGLIGWDKFRDSDDEGSLGVSALPDNVLQFEFKHNPEDILELLRMPYFGFWCSTKNGNIVSSGSYKLVHSDGRTVTLSLRSDWFASLETSPQNLYFKFQSYEKSNLPQDPFTISKIPYFKEATSNENAFVVASPPTRFEGFVLSPFKKGLFFNLRNREIFRDRIHVLSQKYGLSTSFYLTAPNHRTPTLHNEKMSGVGEIEPLTFALERDNYSSEEMSKLKSLLEEALQKENLDFTLVSRGSVAEEFFKKTDSNSYFDARIATVDIGANIQNFGIKMMFCTKLGITFPDPDKKMEQLVNDTAKNNLVVDKDYEDKFNQIIYTESIIIPLKHHSEKWLVSKSIDPSSMPSIVLFPRFEKIRISK